MQGHKQNNECHSPLGYTKGQVTAYCGRSSLRSLGELKGEKQDEAFLALDKLALRLSSCKPQEEFHDPRFMHLLLLRKALKSF